MLTLYDDVFSPYARKVRIALYEKGVSFERVRALHGDLQSDGLPPRQSARGGASARGRVLALRLDRHLRVLGGPLSRAAHLPPRSTPPRRVSPSRRPGGHTA